MTIGLFRRFAWLLVAVPLSITGCGKKGALIYPDLLVPAAPPVVEARQFGDALRLSFILPVKDMAGRRYDDLSGIRIVKRDEPAGQPPGCSSCAEGFILFRTLELRTLPADVERNGSLVTLLDKEVRVGRRYSYRITPVGGGNIEGEISPAVSTVMVPALPAPVLQVVSHPTELTLEFVSIPPEGGKIVGHQVYRTVKGTPLALQPLTGEPVAGNSFVDQGLDRNTTYVYGVRSVVRTAAGEMVESLLSNQAEGQLKNDE